MSLCKHAHNTGINLNKEKKCGEAIAGLAKKLKC